MTTAPPPPPPPLSAVDAAVTVTAAAVVAALSLSVIVLVRLFLELPISAQSPVRAATAAVLGVLAAGYVAARLRLRLVPSPPVVPGAAAALRASAEVLVAAACVSLVNLLLVPVSVLAPAAGAEEATTALQASCLLAVFVVFTAGVLLLHLSVSRPIPETVSRRGIQALKVAGVMLMVVNVPVSVALVCFG